MTGPPDGSSVEPGPLRPASFVARRKATGYTQESLAAAVGVDPSTVRRWELGRTRPRPGLRPLLAETLDVGLDELDDLLRRRTRHGELGFAASPAPFPLPDRAIEAPVDDAVIELIRSTTSALAAAENRFGGRAALEPGLHQLRWAAGLTRRTYRPGLRPDLHRAVGNLAQVVGFCAFDTDQPDLADHCLVVARRHAERGDDSSLTSAILADQARVQAGRGSIDRALATVALAQSAGTALPASASAMLHAMAAGLRAGLGQLDEVRKHVSEADHHLGRLEPDDDRPWLTYYDEAEHHGSIGRALASVAPHTGEWVAPARRFRAALRLQERRYTRSRVFTGIRLTGLLARHGQLDEAAEAGNDVLTEALGLGSSRVLTELASLVSEPAPTESHSPLAHLHQRIQEHLARQPTRPPADGGS